MAMALFSLGVAAYHSDDSARARRALEQSLQEAQVLRDRVIEHLSLVILAQVARREGDLTAAAELNKRCLVIRREEGDSWGVGKALLNLGVVTRARGDLNGARAQLSEAVSVFQEMADTRSCALALSELAAVRAAQQRAEGAARLLGAAEGLAERLGMRWTPERSRINSETLAAVRAVVSPTEADAALAGGRLLMLEDAVREALRVPVSSERKNIPGSMKDGLTAREREILQLLVRGLTSKEIATELVLSVRTVEHHRANVFAKLGTRGRAELVAYVERSALGSRQTGAVAAQIR
jgi:non-specific serine/threonine protein kinase